MVEAVEVASSCAADTVLSAFTRLTVGGRSAASSAAWLGPPSHFLVRLLGSTGTTLTHNLAVYLVAKPSLATSLHRQPNSCPVVLVAPRTAPGWRQARGRLGQQWAGTASTTSSQLPRLSSSPTEHLVGFRDPTTT